MNQRKNLAIGVTALVAAGGVLGMTSQAFAKPTSHGNAKQTVAQMMKTPRIGIVSPMGMEQAPLLANMKIDGQTEIDGYTFYMGTLDGQPVVTVQTGEMEYAITMATTIMDQNFNLKANLLSGTAGARNPNVKVGDVVLSGYVTDQSTIHFYTDGSESGYSGAEMVTTQQSNTQNDTAVKTDPVSPTPQDAATYNNSTTTHQASKNYVYYSALAGSQGLIEAGERAQLASVPLSDITGNTSDTASSTSHVMVGVIAGANQWVDPLVDQKDQNALYQTDAEEDEGFGFGYTNTKFGVPWLVVRGITDSAWYPGVYHGTLGADRAAQVTQYIVDHLPNEKALRQNADYQTLDKNSNAKMHGYIVANKVYYAPNGDVKQVIYQNQGGNTVTVNNPDESEYTYPTQH